MNDRSRILVVDDDDLLRMAIQHTLEPAGYEILTAQSGLEALELTRLQHPDLLLLDVSLPDLDGLEVCRRIKADPQLAGTFVLLLSGQRIDSDSQSSGLETGADGYITRPIPNRELLARLQSLLRLKAAQTALRESEAFLSNAFNNSPLLMSISDLDTGRYLQVNDSFCRVSEYDRDEAIGKTSIELGWLGDEDRTRLVTELKKNGKITGFDLTLRSKSGRTVICRYSGDVIQTGQGNKLFSTAEDITERRQFEASLKGSQENYRQLVETLPDGVVVHSQGRIVFANSTSAKIIGAASPVDLIGMPVIEFVHPDYRDQVIARIQQTLKGIPAPTVDEKFIKLDGKQIDVQVATVPVSYADKPAILTVVNDVTERKHAEKLQDAIFRIAQAAGQARDLDSLYPSLHAIIKEIMVADNFYIALYDEEEDLLSFPYSVDEVDPPLAPQKPGHGLTEYVLRTGRSLLCDEFLFEDLRLRREVELVGMPSPIWLGVPLIIDGGAIGVMAVQHYQDARACGPREQRILEFVSSQVANAIHHKRAEETFRASEGRYRSLYENATIGIYRTTPGGRITMANPALLRMLGYASFEEISRRDLATDGYEPAYPRLEFQQRIEREGEVHGLESAWQRKDGSMISVRESAVLIRDEQDQPAFYEGTVEDITERMHAEQAMLDAKDYAESLIKTANTMVVGLDLNGNITAFNQAAEAITGYSLSDFQGRNWFEVIVPKERYPQVWAVFQKLVGGDLPKYFENPILTRTGEERYIVWQNNEVVEKGKIVGSISFGMDITERKQTEEQIRRLNADLEQRVEERTRDLRETQEKLIHQEKMAIVGQLAGTVGHELRNPLAVITNAVYYLKLVQPDASGKIKEYLGTIDNETRSAEKIITDLLDFARINSMQPVPLSANDLVQRVVDHYPIPESVTTQLNLPADLPSAFADPRQMEQVLGNLVVNACQAMPDGGQLTLSARHSSGIGKPAEIEGDSQVTDHRSLITYHWIQISVQDTGTGISPGNMKKLFEPLFTTRARGIGLGLAVSQKLVEANGGRIEVQSELGQGSTFTLFLPVSS